MLSQMLELKGGRRDVVEATTHSKYSLPPDFFPSASWTLLVSPFETEDTLLLSNQCSAINLILLSVYGMCGACPRPACIQSPHTGLEFQTHLVPI